MKNRRDFLKFLGIGAGACIAAGAAVVAGRGGTPTIPPRTLPEMERVKTYEGPNDFPGGDFIQRKPDIIRDISLPVPERPVPMPDIMTITDEMREQIIDNVFNSDPFYQYLTTTDTTAIKSIEGTSNNDMSLTINNGPASDYYHWTTTWAEMSHHYE